MDAHTHPLLQSFAAALAALHPHGGASVSVCTADGALVEGARAGALTALAHLPTRVDIPSAPDVDGPFDAVPIGGGDWWLLGLDLYASGRRRLGHARIVTPERPATTLTRAARAICAHASVALEQAGLHHELQRSFNGLFIVYEAGQLLNVSHTAEEVLGHVTGLLARTLHFEHCAVMLLHDGLLAPAAQIGLDPAWTRRCRQPLSRSYAARVLGDGAAAQYEDAANLHDVQLPVLTNGATPGAILCAPLTTRSGTLGFLEVYRPMSGAFTDDELFLVSALAMEMAAALENARLYEALREREGRLTQYAAKLVNSQEEERRRISRDIHDGLGQMIVSAFQYLQAHEYSLNPEHPRAAFSRGLDVLQECVAETRRVMSDLRPSTLDDFGLVVALQQQLDAAAAEAGWQASFDVVGSTERLAPAVETTIFRVVQEALNNARKYARAERVQVALARRAGEITVQVRDWGCGFAVDGVAARPERGEHLGLMGMRERVALLGGTVTIESAPGAGATVRIVLPVD